MKNYFAIFRQSIFCCNPYIAVAIFKYFRDLIIYQVDMTPEQKARVDSIVEHYRAATASLREDYRARSEELQREARRQMFGHYRELVSETTTAIKEQLAPEQVEVYDSLLAEHDRRREEARQEARQEAQSLLDRARTEIQREREAAVNELRREFASLAISAAEKVINRSLDREAHRQLIDEVLEESSTKKGE